MTCDCTRHLTKLYDSMAKLKMDGDSKMAVGMWAKDGEYVQFSQKCDCDGKVSEPASHRRCGAAQKPRVIFQSDQKV